MKGKEKFALDGSSIIVIYFKGPFINILDSPSERVLLSSSSASLVLPFSPLLVLAKILYLTFPPSRANLAQNTILQDAFRPWQLGSRATHTYTIFPFRWVMSLYLKLLCY